METGDYDKAMADTDTALRLDPEDEDVLNLRGEIRAARAAQ
jgi:cytochrome c-type biogenesis protein CcmH/NrfG